MINIFTEFDAACMECANFIFDSEEIQTSYIEHIKSHNDPRDHIFYYASVVLGKTDTISNDIMEYDKWTS
jgi:hypothetical protein